MNKRVIWILFAGIMAIAVTTSAKASDFPSVLYVNSTNGLRGRAEPSTNSRVIETLLYGERVVILDRSSAPVTIDGITDYWYFNGRMWFFGGYLSENFPSDIKRVIEEKYRGDFFGVVKERGYEYLLRFYDTYTGAGGRNIGDNEWDGMSSLADSAYTLGNKMVFITEDEVLDLGIFEDTDTFVFTHKHYYISPEGKTVYKRRK
jgi:hypothetical protein